ncbi:MAG TPA: SIMPL domain-containing protein [Longimicrobiales bacterium]
MRITTPMAHRRDRAPAALAAIPAIAAALLLPACAARAQQPETAPPARERTITVTGTGAVDRTPDQAVILLAVESTAPTAQAAAESNAQTMERLIAALRRLGLGEDRVRTASYQLHPEYARNEPRAGPEEPRIVGYRAMNMVRVTVDDVERVGEVIDAALAAGANRVTGLHFQLRDPHAARHEALAMAVDRARAEAEVLARALGQGLGPVLSISSTGMIPPPIPLMMDRMEAVAARTTPIEPGTLRVEATVTAVYRLLPQ